MFGFASGGYAFCVFGLPLLAEGFREFRSREALSEECILVKNRYWAWRVPCDEVAFFRTASYNFPRITCCAEIVFLSERDPLRLTATYTGGPEVGPDLKEVVATFSLLLVL